MPDPFDKYAAMLDSDTQQAPAYGEEADDYGEETPEELTATAEALPGAEPVDPFDKYASMLNESDNAAPPAVREDPNNLTKRLSGLIEQNVMQPVGNAIGITGEGGFIPMAQQLGQQIYNAPGEISKDPAGAFMGLGTGVLQGGADLIDTMVNNTAAMGNVKGNPLLEYMKLGPLGGSIKAAQNIQKTMGGPINLRESIESSEPGKFAAQRTPSVTGLAQSLPMALATILSGGGGLIGRAAVGAGENMLQTTLSNMNRQAQAGQPMDPKAAFNQSKGAGWMGALLAGVLGRRGHGGESAAAPMAPEPSTNARWPEMEAAQLKDIEARLEADIAARAQKNAAANPSETARAGKNSEGGPDRQLPAETRPRQTTPTTRQQMPIMVEKELPAPIKKGMPMDDGVRYQSYGEKVPRRIEGPTEAPRQHFREEPVDVEFEPVREPSQPTPAPRVSEFTSRIKKGGDLAHAPGKAGFRRAKGPKGQSTNKAELVNAEGQPVIGDNGKPVSYSWKSLDDFVKPKHVPEKVMREYERVAKDNPVEPEAPPVEAPAPKAPEPEPVAKEQPKPQDEMKIDYDEATVSKAKQAAEKIAGKKEGIQKNLDKLERGDVKEQMKLNKKTGELEPTEVRAERARGYIKDLEAQGAAIDNALSRYTEAIENAKKGEETAAANHADYAEAALKGLKEAIESFTKVESGQGVGEAPIVTGLIAGIKLAHRIAKKAKLGDEAMAQHWSGFADKVARTAGDMYRKVQTPEGRAQIADAVKGAAGLMNDFDIIQKFDPNGLSMDMSRHRGVLETLMYDAKLPETVKEREAFAKTRTMSADEIMASKEMREAMGEEKQAWVAAVKQVTDSMVDDIRSKYKDVEGTEYGDFLRDFHESITGRTIKSGDVIHEKKINKVAKNVKNAFYDNIVKGNWGIHSIHLWDAIVHGGSTLGRHFWKGATKAYGNKVVKDYVRGYKGSGLMKSARSGDSPTFLEKHVGGALERAAEKNKVIKGALKVGQALEGGWMEGEKMHVLRAGVLERVATDMKIKGGAEALVTKLKNGELTPNEVIEIHSRQASLLSDIIGYNPSGILNRNAFQRNLGAVGSIIQPFIGMRTVQSRLLFDNYKKAFVSGKLSDLKQAATMHALLVAVGGSAAITRGGKAAIKGTLGAAALNETEKFMDSLKILPGINVSHLTPDVVPYLFATFDNASRMASTLGKFMADPAGAFSPENVAKVGIPAVGSTIGGSAGGLPSIGNIAKFAGEMQNASKGVKETYAFDDTSPLQNKYVGKVEVDNYDMFDALLSFMSPHDIDKTHHAKEMAIHADRVLEDIGKRYGPKARLATGKAISEHGKEPDWNKVNEWAKQNFDRDEWREYEKQKEEEKEQRKQEKRQERQALSTH